MPGLVIVALLVVLLSWIWLNVESLIVASGAPLAMKWWIVGRSLSGLAVAILLVLSLAVDISIGLLAVVFFGLVVTTWGVLYAEGKEGKKQAGVGGGTDSQSL